MGSALSWAGMAYSFTVIFVVAFAAQLWIFAHFEPREGYGRSAPALGGLMLLVALGLAAWMVADPPRSDDCPTPHDKQGIYSDC